MGLSQGDGGMSREGMKREGVWRWGGGDLGKRNEQRQSQRKGHM